jgi:hypothetical protein
MQIKLSPKDIEAFKRLPAEGQEEFKKFAKYVGNPSAIKLENYLTEEIALPYDNPHLEFIHYMSRPENFWFTCKWLLNINLHPFQVAILQELWQRKFPMLVASRGAGKTFILAIYSILRALFHQNSKVVIVGAAFRQSKLMFDYIDTIYRNSPILRSICHEHPKRDIDQCFFNVGQSRIIAIPLGDGQKIRGLRANYIIADEFASIPLEIFEIVIKGFGSVSANPTDRADKVGNADILRQLGYDFEAKEIEDSLGFGNQTIISGTAYYAFNHFYDYWKRYKAIIESRGDVKKLEEMFEGKIQEGFDWKSYSIIRIPFEALPKGFMDEAAVASSRATVHSGIYQMEYGAVFAEDSNGFFKRSLIESCVTTKPVEIKNGSLIKFGASLIGNPSVEYVYGIDPASEQDNLALTILEVNADHRRIVYCWTLNKQKLRERLKGQDAKTGFYNYCARKIRELMKMFPTKHIGIDTQGGGLQLMEALHNPSDLLPLEDPFWPYIVDNSNPTQPDPFWWEMEKKPTDLEGGKHNLHPINFAKAEFTSEANHGLKKDFEDKTTLFPAYDGAVLADAIAHDQLLGREFDTLEDCIMEIEELKNELATIELTQTTSQARERWDTPEVKRPGGKKGRLRKDRYSALVIANMLARAVENRLKGTPYTFAGGYAGQGKHFNKSSYYHGPEHITERLNPASYRGISRR